jgi:cysteine-rich repeat protein
MTIRVAFVLVLVGSVAAACSYVPPGGNGGSSSAGGGSSSSGAGGESSSSSGGMTVCGNGVVELAEECDDGNSVANDGCSSSCTVEQGWQCTGAPSICMYTCGNGSLDINEECDDSNTNNGDGCNATCTLRGESTLFVGMPGQPGTVDGVGTAALVSGGQYMVSYGDKLYLGKDQIVRVVDIQTREVKIIAGSVADPGSVDAPIGTNARFEWISGIATDGTTIWVADNHNHIIRAITVAPPHAVTTIAGVLEKNIMPIPILDGDALSAKLGDMRGLTYLNGALFFLEATAAVLRVYDPVGKKVSTYAGQANVKGNNDGFGANARFMSPRYLTTDGVSMLYISDFDGRKIRAYDTGTGEVTTVAGTGTCSYKDGAGTTALLNAPRGLAFDGTSVYFAESESHTIRQIVLGKSDVSTLSGTPIPCTVDCSCSMPLPGGYAEGGPTQAQWWYPYDIVYHAGSRSLFVSDGMNNVIRRIN